MKRLNLIYNHYIFDEPYKQSEVKAAAGKISALIGEDAEIVITHTSPATPSAFREVGDFIIAEHTFAMTGEEKAALAAVLRDSVTRLKRCGKADVVISFRKIEDDDLYVFLA